MKKILLLIVICLLLVEVKGQITYERADSITIEINGKTLLYPFLGGFNAPQFNEIDLNFDGLMDLIILDRSGKRLSPFINNGTTNTIDYRYAPEYINLFPKMRDWLITGDYNCDGKMDLFIGSSDISVFENTGTVANGLTFINRGKVRSNYGSIIANVNAGNVNKPAIFDVNGDGDLDLFFYDQNGSQMEFHKNLSFEQNSTCGLIFERRSWCWGNFTESSLSGKIYLDSCRFGDMPNPESDDPKNNQLTKGPKHSGSTVTAFDLDNTGSTDLLVGDVGGNRITALYNNDSISPYIDSYISHLDSIFPSYDVSIDLPIFPAVYILDLDNDGKMDMVTTTNSNSYGSYTKAKDNILFYKNLSSAATDFQFQPLVNLFYDEIIDLGKGCYPSFFDYDNDGLIDLLMGNIGNLNSNANNIEGRLSLYKNIGTATQPSFRLIDDNFINLPNIPLDLNNNIATTYVIPTLADLDGDGDQDLLIGDFQGNLHYFEDTSSQANPASFKLVQAGFEGIEIYSNASPSLYDVDKDSLYDLVVGTGSGRLEFYKNVGEKTHPIFTLKVQSILWQHDSIIRYQLSGNPDLSSFSPGQMLDINNSNWPNNGVYQKIAAVNNTAKYIDLIHPFRTDATDDETSTNAFIDYSNKNWGLVDLNKHQYNRDAAPLFYTQDNSLRMVLASRNGTIYYYDSLDQHVNSGSFNLVDSTYIDDYFGEFLGIAGHDLNNDGILDLAIGNEAGGLNILMGKGFVGLDETKAKLNGDGDFMLYPNPSNTIVTIITEKGISTGSSNSISIMDINGKIIQTKKLTNSSITFSTENWANGVYFIRFQNEKESKTKKLVVQH